MLEAFLYSLGAILVAATALPLWRTSRWWVRLCDFPRFQIAILCCGVLVITVIVQPPSSAGHAALLLAVALAAFWQLSWIWPHFPGAPQEVSFSKTSAPECNRIALLTSNVLQSSRNAGKLIETVLNTAPDIFFAVETDEWWQDRLNDALASRYPHRVSHPLSNGYGVALFSSLELADVQIRFIVDEAIPSIKARVRLRSGAIVDVYGLHPRPPSVLQDSLERDVELILVGREIRSTRRPSIVIGDLNDVAWSPTTTKFKQLGGLLDPRRGRGFFNTYPAHMPGLRYPLDHLFHTPHFSLGEMRVLPSFGSDHLPLTISLYLDETDGVRQQKTSTNTASHSVSHHDQD
jgi:endonuclease/exonuclease/phosphatase (EEP) superfamily protein YafD